MDVHPIFVHFPIGLLTFYVAIEVVSIIFKRRLDLNTFTLRAVLVIAGSLASYATLATGDGAEDLILDRTLGSIVEAHSFWAELSTAIFTILAVGYLLAFIFRNEVINLWIQRKFSWFYEVLLLVKQIILNQNIRLFLALIGLLAITITGALGGAIVYGPEIDPIISVIYHWFFNY